MNYLHPSQAGEPPLRRRRLEQNPTCLNRVPTLQAGDLALRLLIQSTGTSTIPSYNPASRQINFATDVSIL